MCEYVVVFFSSRRRHTRYWRDWSSDVCSSDLAADAEEAAAAPGSESRSGRGPGRAARTGDDGEGLGRRPAAARAEAPERRRRKGRGRSGEHTSELQARQYLVCRLLLEKKKNTLHALRLKLHHYHSLS